ncbi:hypothetical protein KL905_002675 [Ogataea polymorpha]|uniref:Uncharacterized protein n=1 Tax=Ogataea polymorpha TaxID=460523 RepID=A0A1B7SP55_9ASCO|nr:uncharacterized protein OGAPODRAFT_45417 [Ogataea polymorpha]KAG7880701.1 hypothetical protein KL937_002263 [Ogataea polymorpha]KAG7889499.1 hypothetical protein KL936_003073 [Ogataea polymorpha]KAG7894468.1 hypothetical protein KL908_001840 [Ogataea polymorpha]KAG7899940.1 hypothetical protein KL935_003481 [Ogataea polymorpha]KAG7906779.1 hypothetical protein KL907_002419 [Ogataea polymorpha]
MSDTKVDILKFADKDGEYKRKPSVFRDFISSKAGAKFPPEAGRYHLYVSYACPWAHRTLIVRALKGLTALIGVSVVHWHMDDKGWRFPSNDDPCEGATEDKIYGVKRLKELYFKADKNYDGRFTVPILWDTKTETIVNNESSEIIRMLNFEFNSFLDEHHAKIDLYPSDLQQQIDDLNDWIYPNINNGVYKAGFATKQEPYEKEVKALFEKLDEVEEILRNRYHHGEHYLTGNILTEADVRLFTTIVRFDPVYVQHFKCNLKMIRYDYPHIHQWLRELYWTIPSFKDTTNFSHIKLHYTKSHVGINPHHITPIGPIPNIVPLGKFK